MTRLRGNIGHFDAISRRVVGTFAVLAGLGSLDGFYRSMGFLTEIHLAFMVALGFFFITGGMRGGSAIFGLVLIALAVGDGWLALHHEGAWALLIGVVVGTYGFITAEIGWCPINSLFKKDTHNVDPEWAAPHPAH
jgi:hypothetical protein